MYHRTLKKALRSVFLQHPSTYKTFMYMNERGKLMSGKTEESGIRASNGCFRCVALIGTSGTLLNINKAELDKPEKVSRKVLLNAISAAKPMLAKANGPRDPSVSV